MSDPFGMDPEFLGRVPFFAELQRLLQWKGGPINWDLARQLASATTGPLEGAGARAIAGEAADDAAHHASLLIGSVIDLPTSPIEMRGATEFSSELIENTKELFEAVARRATTGITEGIGLPEQMPEGMGEALQAMGPMLQGAQTGTAIGNAAADVIGWCDLGLPIERPAAVLLPAVVGRITREAPLDERAALLASLLRVGVDHAVVSNSSGIRSRFLSAFLELVATLEHDLGQLGEQLRNIDPNDPNALAGMLSGGFGFERSPASDAASAQVDAITSLYVASVDRLTIACAAQAGLDAGTIETCSSRRSSDKVVAFRAALGLSPIDTSIADPFVTSVVLEGGFELLKLALDDPLLAPSLEDLRDPTAWIARAKG